MEDILVLIVMNTFDNLGSDKRAFCDDTLQGHHVIEMIRA